MAYKTKRLFEQALAAIKEHKLFFVEDVCAMLGCAKSTFYSHFPNDSDRYRAIDEALTQNKIQIKVGIRAKLYKSTKAGELLALYRLVCDSDERRMLNQQYIDHTTDGKKMEINITRKVVNRNDPRG